MLELPEIIARKEEMSKHLLDKTVHKVLPPSKEHKFCWYNGDPGAYHPALAGKRIVAADGFGIFAELVFEDGQRLCLNDGINMRLMDAEQTPANYQLLIEFTDGQALVFTVAMYGGIYLHDGSYDNEYYLKSKQAVSPFSPEFQANFEQVRAQSKKTLSVKAFLAAEQRFPGIGNGVLQDILLEAGILPKRKTATLTEADWQKLLVSTVHVLEEMTKKGGRDTERDLFGKPGGYQTKMSKNTISSGCPVCGGPITKEAYMGGSVYYCKACQC